MFLLYRRYSLFWIALGAIAVYAIAGLRYADIIPRDYCINNDLDTRLSIWLTALKGIAVHPLFGGGGNAYTMIYAAFNGHEAVHAHNLILDELLNYGIVGFALVFICFFRILKSTRRGAANDVQIRYMVYTALWCVLVHGMMDVTIFWIQTSIVFLFLLSGSFAPASQFHRTPASRVSAGFDAPCLGRAEGHIQLIRRTAYRQ
jgi:O-antigen ligase